MIGAGMWGFNKVMPMAGCFINFEAARQGLVTYAKEHDGNLPKKENWQRDLKPYVQKYLGKEDLGPVKAFDPNAAEWYCETDGRRTGIAYNSEIAGKKLADIKDPYMTIAFFEIENPRANAAEVYKRKENSTSPKIFGEPRGWIAITLEGDVQGMKKRSSGGIRIDTDTGTSKDSEK